MREKVRRRGPMRITMFPPTGGTGQPKASAMTELAFSPVVTRAVQEGIRASNAGTSVGVTTSK